MTIMECLELLSGFLDESDPDVSIHFQSNKSTE